MAKCGACDSKILFGGTRWAAWQFCDEKCARNLKITLTKEYVDKNEIDRQVEEVHKSHCVLCGKDGPNDVYATRKVTGMILAVQWATESHLCCASCAKIKRFKAFGHCLLFGWWSPKAFITNVFYIPYNVIAALATRSTSHPSKSLELMVMEIIANNNSQLFVKKVIATKE